MASASVSKPYLFTNSKNPNKLQEVHLDSLQTASLQVQKTPEGSTEPGQWWDITSGCGQLSSFLRSSKIPTPPDDQETVSRIWCPHSPYLTPLTPHLFNKPKGTNTSIQAPGPPLKTWQSTHPCMQAQYAGRTLATQRPTVAMSLHSLCARATPPFGRQAPSLVYKS